MRIIQAMMRMTRIKIDVPKRAAQGRRPRVRFWPASQNLIDGQSFRDSLRENRLDPYQSVSGGSGGLVSFRKNCALTVVGTWNFFGASLKLKKTLRSVVER
jgi:hypothetical protein